MNTCICCSGKLLSHIRHNSRYWFCPHCREEMPILTQVNEALPHEFKKISVLKRLQEPESVVIK